ncbi:MAG: leucyl aminopeptidase [Anaplasmataceae bacterium]|nr:leucyl aminopeptidase [Candidatus Heimdallarchaeota archaeon]MDH5795964.1 leucyl aminopeptidase [Anaplasmataceae bacterium]
MIDVSFCSSVDGFFQNSTLVVGFFKHNIDIKNSNDYLLSGRIAAIDHHYNGMLYNNIKLHDFKGEKETDIRFSFIDQVGELRYVIVVGLGSKDQFDKKIAEATGEYIYKIVKMMAPEIICIFECDKQHDILPYMAMGMLLADYKFDHYLVARKEKTEQKFKKAIFGVDNAEKSQQIFAMHNSIIDGINLSKDFCFMPPNVLYPESYANEIKNVFKDHANTSVDIIDEKQMQKQGMGAFLGVSKGSSREGKLVTINYKGASDKTKAPVILIGKGVTFDSGGISIKPAGKMWEMKGDMAGSALVIGTILSLVKQKVPVNVVGVVGLAENAVSGDAQYPSDIVYSKSGQTIEVLNTDAEGRLILADCISYARSYVEENFGGQDPQCILDFATLTGAIIIGLGSHYAGLFSNDDSLSEKLLIASKKTGERLWRMPLDPDYDKALDSKVADMRNIALERGADSSMAAQFLQRFVTYNSKNIIPWAHFDIAGVAGRGDIPTGYGIRLVYDFIANIADNSNQ